MEWLRRLAMIFSLAAIAAACVSALAARYDEPQIHTAASRAGLVRNVSGPGAEALARLCLEEEAR